MRNVETGALKHRFADDLPRVGDHEAANLLRRALHISRAVGWDTPEGEAAKALAGERRKRAIAAGQPLPAHWFSALDLDFVVSDPADVANDIEGVISRLESNSDPHDSIELWRLASRGYHYARRDEQKFRCRLEAAERLAAMALAQPMAMTSSIWLSDAIAELHGLPGQKERRKAWRHRLIDVQAGVTDEMSSFSHPLELEEIIKQTERFIARPTLRDMFFAFAALGSSPDPGQLANEAADLIRQHPLSSIFAGTHLDREGKVIHRSNGGGSGDGDDATAMREKISQSEHVRRQIMVSGHLSVALQSIQSQYYVSDDLMERLLARSAFVPSDLLRTYSRGFARFFQGDVVGAIYIITPLLEASLRQVLRASGHDPTIFNDATRTQEDRTISSMFEGMRPELDGVFGEPITSDIERLFLQKPGPHLRHALMHGLLHDSSPYGADAIYACWLVFRLCLIPLFHERGKIFLDGTEPPTETTQADA